MSDTSDKTEEPTEHKLREARRQGQTSKSQDANSAAVLLVSVLCLLMFASVSMEHFSKLFSTALDIGRVAKDSNQLIALAYDLAIEGLWITLPFVIAVVLGALVVSFAQVGIKISFDPVSPDFNKLNPAEGLKNLVSIKSVLELCKSILKTLLVGAVVYWVWIDLLPLLVGSSTQSALGVAQIAWAALLKLLLAVLAVFLIIAPADWALQRWQFMRGQRMSMQDIKREHKDHEGDPHLKSEQRQQAREDAKDSPKSRVPKATVVVTNPTHYAVALIYTPGVTALPIVVAKGADAKAAEIRRIALESGVPIVGNPPLARALFKVEIDSHVPEDLFNAVAAVIRWVGTLDHVRTEAKSLS
jgi:type III secretion protein U